MRLAARLGAVGLLGLLAGFLACTGDDGAAPGADAAAGASGASSTDGAAGDGAVPWDPVWHKTTPAGWQTIPPESPAPDCGPGCRMAINVPVWSPYAGQTSVTTQRVIGVGKYSLVFASLGLGTTSVIPNGDTGDVTRPSMWGDHVAALRSRGGGDGQVEIVSLTTGERKIAFEYSPEDAGNFNADEIALGPHHVYFHYKGLESFNLDTGELKRLLGGPSACYSMCATDSGLLCEDGKIYFLQPDTGPNGSVTYVDNGGEMQVDGQCSPDRKRYAWVDFRDPPGPGSTYDFGRNGGEIYMRDLALGKTVRLTFDSPASPRGKIHPAVGDDLAVWSEPDDGAPQNPPDLQTLFQVSDTLAKVDLKTGERCRLQSGPGYISYKSLVGHHMYALLDRPEGWRLIDLDLDDPGLTWQCQPTPNWPSGGVP